MSIVYKLMGYGLRQVIGDAADQVVGCVERLFTDHSQTLNKALTRANDRTWQALGIALAGDGFFDQVKVFFASGDDKGIREQVRLFLQSNAVQFEGCPAGFRKACLTELKTARQIGRLSALNLSSKEIAHQTASSKRFADPKGMVDSAQQVVSQIADALATEFPDLGQLLKQGSGEGPPLIVAAFAYFFRREVETDEELAHGLFFDGLRQLSASQAKAFVEVGKALTSLGGQFEQVFEQLTRIETAVVETQTVVVATHGAVLDIQAELQRLGSVSARGDEEVRGLLREVIQRVSKVGMQNGEIRPQHSLSIRSEDERAAVKLLLARFRQLPPDQQIHLPALLNGLGKLQVGSGDFAGATQTFVAVANAVTDSPAKAEAHYNAFRAALERRDWATALRELQEAVRLDRRRFEPFPFDKYEPQGILGAGGFGVAFLCRHRYMNASVVVKTLSVDDLEQKVDKVFSEAQILRQLDHPAIIRVTDCGYMDVARRLQPFLVMDYFDGLTLEEHVKKQGPLSVEDWVAVFMPVAEGLQTAHAQNILHRDVNPANLLVRKEGSKWKVKLIDFGLALRQESVRNTVNNLRSHGDTLIGSSIAGTMDYAAPEQMGKLSGVAVGPYSDVYGFGKTCYFALCGTPEPDEEEKEKLPSSWRKLLGQCTARTVTKRPANLMVVLGQLSVASTVFTHMRQAEKYTKAGEYDKAIADYTEAIRLNPTDALAYITRGNAFWFNDEDDKAIADYTEAIRLDPKIASFYHSRGMVYYYKDEYDEAIADYTEAIRLDPKIASFYHSRGMAYYYEDEDDKAIADYTEAIRLDPKIASFYHSQGLAHYDEDEYDEAIADYTEAIRLDPKIASFYHSRGIAHYDSNEYDEAIADYTEAIRLNPSDASAYSARG